MARPKSEDPPQTFCIRLSGALRAQFTAVAVAQRRKPAELLRLLAEDAVAAHEAKHGPIPPATPAAPVAPGAGVAG